MLYISFPIWYISYRKTTIDIDAEMVQKRVKHPSQRNASYNAIKPVRVKRLG